MYRRPTRSHLPRGACAAATVASLAAACAHAATQHASDGPAAAAFLSTWCLDCHDNSRAKGGVNFEGLVARLPHPDRTVDDSDLLRKARLRIADGIMPPAGHDAPTPGERAAVLPALAHAARVAPERIIPPGTSPRRLNRVEYANTMRDLYGVDVSDIGTLPPDDVGAGFDTIASVLSLSPATFERLLEIAEGVAQHACPDRDAGDAPVRRASGRDLRPQPGAGQVHGQTAVVWSNGYADCAFDLPRDGVYSLAFKGFGMQAGPEPVRCALVVDGTAVAPFDLPETDATPGERRAEVALRGGTRRIGVGFLNDYYQAGPPREDRNLAVLELTVHGPLDRAPEPAWRRAMDAACAHVPEADRARAQRAWLVHRAFRRPCTDADHAYLDAALTHVTGGADAHLRATIVALSVAPDFLFRVEAPPPPGEVARDLSPHELAARLSYYLWASTPDAELLRAAGTGALADPAERARQVARMLRDPRGSALAERFAPQWLGIDGLDARMPDPGQFAGVDAALLQSMRSETVLLFDTVLREDRQVRELLDADYTFVDARLAAHYGMPAPGMSGPGAAGAGGAGAQSGAAGVGMRRTPVPPDRGGGVLAHASVLLATSNPTRTSPVKRGKWVLEALLDSPPPPPPPGTAALPERPEDRGGLTLRETLERHRLDPSCAACHLRMDALGFAFEHYDAVGRHRDRADGAPVDARGELPDGRDVASLGDLRAILVSDPDFVRSVAKHLTVYATGRAAAPADEAAVDALVEGLGPAPTLRQIVVAVTESPLFLRAGAPTETGKTE